MKAFGYLRVSGQGQVQGDGFTRQEEAIKAYAEKAGYEGGAVLPGGRR